MRTGGALLCAPVVGEKHAKTRYIHVWRAYVSFMLYIHVLFFQPSLVTMGIVGDQQTQDQQMGLGGGTGVQAVPSYEQNLQDIESYISGLDGNSVRTLCFRLLEGHGGVSLAKSILEATPEGPEPSIPNRSPDWCICGNCLPMPSPIENVCCRRRHCITRYDVFQLICLHPVVLRVAVRNNCDWRADPIIYSHSNFRKAAYRQYILWVYGRLGRGNRRVAPSCVVCRIRSRYPSSYGTYLGFRDV